MNSIFFRWEYVALIAVAGGLLGTVLRVAVRKLVGWFDVRLMPTRYLKKCGVRRRKPESQMKRVQHDA